MSALRHNLAAAALAIAVAMTAVPTIAVLPDERLQDPALEARARALSEELRCLVCQNQSIDDSDADLARDLRIIVRERIKAGDSDRAVKDYLVARYGEFVLLKPRFEWHTLVLWATGPVLLLAGVFGAIFAWRRRAAAPDTPPLTAEEEARLKVLVDQSGKG